MKSKDKLSQEQVWNEIAPLWNRDKVKPFGDSNKENIIEKVVDNKDKKILDMGCGSGRNFAALKAAGFKGELYGIDFSGEMLKYARVNADRLGLKFELKKASVDKLPFEDNFFDKIIYIATLHCVETEKERKKSIEEAYRVLKSGGKVLITVWNKQNKRWRGKAKEKYVGWNLESEGKVLRHYYLYDYDELKNELEKVGFKILWKNYTDVARNIIIIAEK